jgi:hypothetical protein
MKGRYWVDANTFIWGARDPYPMDGAMKYWIWFEKMSDTGKITTHKKVIKEILDGEKKGDPDPLIPWVKARQAKLANQTSDTKQLQDLVGELCEFSLTKFGIPKTIEFTKGADLFLIAHAKLDDGAVVTQESEKKLVRIPTVCNQFGVKFMTIFQMNKELKMNLI